MNKDNSGLLSTDNDDLSIKSSNIDSHNISMKGEVIDKIYKNGVLVDTIYGCNLVVNSFLKLVMSLCKGESGYGGIQYWAIGSGNASWDDGIPDPEINATRLTSEIGRVAINPSEIKFLTADYSESSTPTNILQIKHTFTENDCNGEWREFGIFGGNAFGTANTGIMINKKHHAVITKTSDMMIERTMRFTLNLV